MRLADFVAEHRKVLYDDLLHLRSPSRGTFDAARLADARTKGSPQLGSTRYEPHAITFEFIYADPRASSVIVEVRVETPDRVVWMSVPAWVIENIWEGEITGSFAFLADAEAMLDGYRAGLEEGANLASFGVTAATRRG
ncbi:MAG: hypothetical protein SFX74_11280 [Fimbriimonadaceae bacterium]|nr:hypothetical protein [Fimbriimonadaceae bacterium]